MHTRHGSSKHVVYLRRAFYVEYTTLVYHHTDFPVLKFQMQWAILQLTAEKLWIISPCANFPKC